MTFKNVDPAFSELSEKGKNHQPKGRESRIMLEKFTKPERYREVYLHNLGELNKTDWDPCFQHLIETLSASTGISHKIVAMELKRSIGIANEATPGLLKTRLKNLGLPVIFLLNAIKHQMREFRFKAEKADIIVDLWFQDARDNFYGEEFLRRLSEEGKCLLVDFNKEEHYGLLSALRLFPKYFRACLRARRISAVHGLDLQRFLYRFFVNYLAGKAFASVGAKMVLSGQDNGCSIVKAKAAGCETFFIQNGLRMHISDTCFKYSDYYVSMGRGEVLQVFNESGCEFRNIYPLGSLRFANYLASVGGRRIEMKYDFLFVESGYLTIFFNPGYFATSTERFDLSFSSEATVKSLQIIKEIADKGRYRVAFQTQFKGETALIKNLGYYSDKITYFEKGERSIYQTALESEVILSTVSTVCMEAMGIGKKVGFINFSGNDSLNWSFRDLNAEYNSASKEDFDSFLERIRKQSPECLAALAHQDPDYIAKVMHIVRGILVP